MPTVVSLTPAVFHLPEAVNRVSQTYGASPIVPRGPAFAPLLARAREGICEALGAPEYEAVLMTGSGSTAMAAVLGSCLAPEERLLVVRRACITALSYILCCACRDAALSIIVFRFMLDKCPL